jgi:hypothetical protein
MTEKMPEKIWANKYMCWGDRAGTFPNAKHAEYTRTDLHEALTAERDALRAEVERLEELLMTALEELEGIVLHYIPVGRHKDDLSLAREILERKDVIEFIKNFDIKEENDGK